MSEREAVRIGKRQIELLASLARFRCAMVVGNRQTARLEALGLVKHHGKDGRSFAAITPDGLRVIADIVDAGKLVWFTLPHTERR